MSYYKTIDGQKYDGKLLSLAEEAIQGAGDGRISVKDAEGLFEAVRDGGVYTDVEKETVAYIRNKFRWTPSAAEWFGSRVASLNYLHRPPQLMTIEEITKQHFSSKDVLTSEADRISREIDLRAATSETYQDHDEIGIIVQLEDGTHAKVLSNFIEMEGDLVELRGGRAIPVRAIVKVEI